MWAKGKCSTVLGLGLSLLCPHASGLSDSQVFLGFVSPPFDETSWLEWAGAGSFPFPDQLGSDNTSVA